MLAGAGLTGRRTGVIVAGAVIPDFITGFTARGHSAMVVTTVDITEVSTTDIMQASTMVVL